MSKNIRGDTLQAINRKFQKGETPSNLEFKALIDLCEHPEKQIREAAATLLLYPPVSDELAYYTAWLIPNLARHVTRMRQLPGALLEFFFDMVAFLEKIPEAPEIRSFFIRILKSLDRSSAELLFEKPLGMRPFLPFIPVRLAASLFKTSSVSFKRRWRILRNGALLNAPFAPPWAETTFSDFLPVWQQQRTLRRYAFIKGRWLCIMRRVVLPPNASPCVSLEFSPGSFYWGGHGNTTVQYLERLLSRQVDESRAVRGLAREVSQKTKRVVLSWHNAGLAASGGWAFEAPLESLPSETLLKEFKESIEKRMASLAGLQERASITVEQIWKLWESRLVIPKVLHALWESRVRLTLDSSWKGHWERDLQIAKAYLDKDSLLEVLEDKKFGWHGALSPHQRMSLEEVVSWHKSRLSVWKEGMLRLAALIIEGQKLMDSGRLPHFVIPWIDKFFISSRREEDRVYLPSLVQWLKDQGIKPLVLFWEDTTHLKAPSFQLTMKKLHERGHPFRGIGVFDWNNHRDRRTASATIVREHDRVSLFALRPYSDTHNPKSLEQLLGSLDARFFHLYDSSWKDNLSFLYTGTQVFPLLSVQLEMEDFPAWIAVEHARYPFGTYLRKRIRKETQGRESPKPGVLPDQYAFWANLG